MLSLLGHQNGLLSAIINERAVDPKMLPKSYMVLLHASLIVGQTITWQLTAVRYKVTEEGPNPVCKIH